MKQNVSIGNSTDERLHEINSSKEQDSARDMNMGKYFRFQY